MKTKILLLVLLSNLTLCLNAEKLYRVVVTDVPEGVSMTDLQPWLHFDYDGPTTTVTMDFDESSNSFVYKDLNDYPVAKKVEFQVGGMYFLPSEWEEWKINSGQQEQTKEVSLKEYRKIFLEPEEGWTFWEQEADGMVTMFQIRLGDSDRSWGTACGSGKVAAEDVAYYVYAKPGDYFWSGTIFDASGKKLLVNQESVTFDDHSDKQMLRVDWANRTLVTAVVEGLPEEEILDFSLYLDQVNQEFFFTKQTEILLERGKTYHWRIRNTNSTFYAYSKTAAIYTEKAEMNLVIDYSDCQKHQLVFKDKEGFRKENLQWEMTGKDGLEETRYNISSEYSMYLPKGYDAEMNLSFTFVDSLNQYWNVFPWSLTLTDGQPQDFLIDASLYHKIDFVCQDQPMSTWITLQGDSDSNNGYYASSALYMPDGKYHASTQHSDGVSLDCDFIVDGADQVVEFAYNPADYKHFTVALQNKDRIPGGLGFWAADFNVMQNGELLTSYPIYLNEGSVDIILEKGSYDYQLDFSQEGPYSIARPLSGSFEVTDTTSLLSVDLNQYCFVPLEVKNESGEQLTEFYYMINGDQSTLDYLEQPMYMILPEGTYQLDLFLGGYEPLNAEIQLNRQISVIPLVMKKADLFPLFVLVENLKAGEIAQVTVDGLGSYTCHEDGFQDGDFLPFMSVKEGIYSVTITAPGYDTYRGQLSVDWDHYSADDLGIFYEIDLSPEGTHVDSSEKITRPKVSLVDHTINVQAEMECTVGVYSVSGICMARMEGKNMRTEALTPGLYLVRIQGSDQQIWTTKIYVGR